MKKTTNTKITNPPAPENPENEQAETISKWDIIESLDQEPHQFKLANSPTTDDEWIDLIKERASKVDHSLLELQSVIVAAKAKIPSGRWVKVIQEGLFNRGLRSVQMLKKVAEHPYVGDTNNDSFLPESFSARHALTPLSLDEAKALVEEKKDFKKKSTAKQVREWVAEVKQAKKKRVAGSNQSNNEKESKDEKPIEAPVDDESNLDSDPPATAPVSVDNDQQVDDPDSLQTTKGEQETQTNDPVGGEEVLMECPIAELDRALQTMFNRGLSSNALMELFDETLDDLGKLLDRWDKKFSKLRERLENAREDTGHEDEEDA